MALTREDILGLDDIQVKEIKVPDWDNQTVFIRKLNRGQQDAYAKRRFDRPVIRQKMGGPVPDNTQDLESRVDIFGHDAWLFAQGVCDENGGRLFANKDVQKLNEKSGEAIGYVASEIVKFSGMAKDIEELEEAKN